MKKLSYFNTLIIDDFLDDPDGMRHYALTEPLKWTKKRWHPGTRTECLSEYDYPLYEMLCQKFLFTYFPELFYTTTKFHWKASCHFHYAVDGDNERFIMKEQRDRHYDKEALCSAIIYLTPDAVLKSGTKTYLPSENGDEPEDIYIGNRYNRMLMFPSGQVLHGVDKTFGTCKEDSRLQILFFLHQISYDLT